MRETVDAFWLCLAGALFANMAASQGGSLSGTLRIPFFRVDGGRTWHDGRPVFGETKSWNGVVLGVIVALSLVALIALAQGRPMAQWVLPVVLGSLGAPFVDLAKSFYKRRRGTASGAPAGIWDRLDVPLGTVAALLLWCAVSSRGHNLFSPVISGLLLGLLLLGPLGHHVVCTLSHRMSLKKSPY